MVSVEFWRGSAPTDGAGGTLSQEQIKRGCINHYNLDGDTTESERIRGRDIYRERENGRSDLHGAAVVKADVQPFLLGTDGMPGQPLPQHAGQTLNDTALQVGDRNKTEGKLKEMEGWMDEKGGRRGVGD